MKISIRRAKPSDITGLNELLYQVHKVHADRDPIYLRKEKRNIIRKNWKKL